MYQVVIKETEPITRVEGQNVILIGFRLTYESIFTATEVSLEDHCVSVLINGEWKDILLREGTGVKVERFSDAKEQDGH